MRSVSIVMMMLVTAPLMTSATAWAASADTGPMATLKQRNGEVDKLLRQHPEKGSPAEAKQKEQIKQLAATLIDYDELAKKSLAAHWDTLTPAQRTEFVSTLRELIERNYTRQLKTNLDYKIDYKKEDVDGDNATVQTIVKVKTSGKASDAEIVYKLRKVSDGWRVWDIITDESSLVRNYKSEFNKIITDKSYDELIKKMKSKLAEQP
jgi:phospholipid transport system substrate-binding protein